MKKYLKCIYIVIFLFPILIFGQVDSGFVDIKGGVLFYKIYGKGEPLVFLNGGPGFSSSGYEMYAKTFASENRKVILFDQRGTGKSKLKRIRRRKFKLKKMAKDIEALRLHLKIEKWDVMGHSFGGNYAMFYAAFFPKSINKMVISGSPNTKHHKYWGQKFRHLSWDEMTDAEQQTFEELSKEENIEFSNSKKIYRLKMGTQSRFYVYKKENYDRALNWFRYECDPNPIVSSFVASHAGKNKVLQNLKHFHNPVLIIHGISDFINISSPLENHKLFPNSELKIVYDSGHMILIDQPEEYKATIESFLNKN